MDIEVIAIIVVATVLLTWQLWVHYLAVMALKRERDLNGLPLELKVPTYLTLFYGLVLDFVINATLCTLVFLDPPKEKTVTSRLKRYIEDGHDKPPSRRGFRYKVASWICHRYLDPFDPDGAHCD